MSENSTSNPNNGEDTVSSETNTVTDDNKQQAFSISWRRFNITIPRYVLEKLKIWHCVFLSIILLSIILLVSAGFYIAYVESPTDGNYLQSSKDGKNNKTFFAGTYVFWTPTFESGTWAIHDVKKAEEVFHKRLKKIFGGWTRWKVDGSEEADDEVEPGWFYQASLPKDKPKITSEDVTTMLKEFFTQSSYYIIYSTHK